MFFKHFIFSIISTNLEHKASIYELNDLPGHQLGSILTHYQL